MHHAPGEAALGLSPHGVKERIKRNTIRTNG